MSFFDRPDPVSWDPMTGNLEAYQRLSADSWRALANEKEKNPEWFVQELIAAAPECLPLAEFNSVFASAVCIGREAQTSSGPIDCLLLSSRARLIVVETKLHQNPESRREVVAQVLDYCQAMSRWRRADVEDRWKAFAAKRHRNESHPNLFQFVQRNLERRGIDVNCGLDEHQFYDQLDRGLSRGEILGLIVGDRVHARAIELVSYANRHQRLGLELGVVELSFFARKGQTRPLLAVGSCLQKTTTVARTVVSVEVRTAGEVNVEVRSEADDLAAVQGGRRPMMASKQQFLDLVKERRPDAETGMRVLLSAFEAVAEEYPTTLEFRLAGASANFYWRNKDDKTCRIFVLTSDGDFGVYQAYSRDAGRDDIADAVRASAEELLEFSHDQKVAKVPVTTNNAGELLDLVNRTVARIMPMLNPTR